MAITIALLRGVNVAAAKRVPMAELRTLLEELGYTDVRTLLNSGNAVFSTGRRPATVRRAIEAAVEERFGFAVSVVVRTAAELAAVVAADPHAGEGLDGKRYLAAFVDGTPDAAGLAKLSALDEVVQGDDVLYLWCPDGVLGSPAAQLATGKHLKVTVTARNWNTVVKLLALAQA